MLVSIIAPVYNVAKYITPCLDSLSVQTYKEIEVIFVDDCGPDDSVQIIRDYVESHPFPTWKIVRHEHNKGLSAARNTGLKEARGEYVYFLDSDDDISPDCIEKLMRSLSDKLYEVVVGSVREQYADGGVSLILLETQQIADPLKAYADGKWYVMAWNKLCNRQFLLDKSLFFEEGLLHEDVVWSFKLACACHSMYTVSDVTYNYKIRSASIMTSMSVEKDAGVYAKAFRAIKQYIDDNGLNYNKDVYRVVEGKKSGILYSLLQVGEYAVFDAVYPLFHEIRTVSPWSAFRKGAIGLGYLLRDMNYCLPVGVGRLYKKMFYNLIYKLRGKKIEGAVWK